MKKKLFIYGIGTFFSKLLVFFMVPIYTRFFSVSDYGYYDVIISDIQMLVSIAFVEIWSGIMRYMYSDKEKEKSIKAFLLMLPVMVLIYAFYFNILSNWVTIKYPVSSFGLGIAYLLFNVGNTYCRGYNKNIAYVISGLIYTFISCGLSLIWTVKFNKDIECLLVAQIIGYSIAVMYVEMTTRAYRNAIQLKVSPKYILELLRYSIPLMINSFSFLFLGTYNKNIVLRILGENSSGQYAFIMKFSAILSIIISIYSLAWQEEAFLKSNDKKRDEIYSFYISNFFKAVGLGIPCYVVCVYFFAPLIGGREYLQANKYILFDIYATYIAQISGLFSVIIAVNKKTWQTLVSTALGALCNVILVNLLINKFGINGASISLAIGFGVSSIIRYIFSAKYVSLRIDAISLLIPFVEVLLLYFIINTGNNYIVCFSGIAFFIIWLFSNKDELRNMYTYILVKIKGEKNDYEKRI